MTNEPRWKGTADALAKVVAAWESLPGNRRYTVDDVQAWISGPMKAAIDNARQALAATGVTHEEGR